MNLCVLVKFQDCNIYMSRSVDGLNCRNDRLVRQDEVNFTLELAVKAQTGSTGRALLFFNFGARWRLVNAML